ncbi:MAG TPA: amidase, partial [Polyangia bacterium]|nr:amidase [Polyangia bacterium]
MASSRRQFITRTALGLAAVAAGDRARAADAPAAAKATPAAATSPPAFGTAPPVGPEVSAATFADAEKLMQVTLTPAERALAASSWRQSMAPLLERRTGPRKVPL